MQTTHQRKQMKWTKCTDRLPQKDTDVLVKDKYGMKYVGYIKIISDSKFDYGRYSNGTYWKINSDCCCSCSNGELIFEELTHWCPLPEIEE
jgi:hypothetical protein